MEVGGHLVVMDIQELKERTELTSHVCSSDGVDIGDLGEVKQVAARLIGQGTGADWFPRQRTGVGVGMAAFILAGGLEQRQLITQTIVHAHNSTLWR